MSRNTTPPSSTELPTSRRVTRLETWWPPAYWRLASALRLARPSITAAADGDIAPGTATGTAQPWCIAAAPTTVTPPGTAATTGPAPPPMVPTAASRTRATATTRQPGLTRVAPRRATHTEAPPPARPTTRAPGRQLPRFRARTPTEAPELRRSARTATLPTPS